MPEPTTLALSALAALATALALAALPIPRGGRWPRAAGASGVALGMVAGAVALGLAPRVPPRDVMGRLLLVVLPAAIVVEAIGPRSRYARPVASVAAPLALLFGSIHLDDPARAVPRVAALAVGLDLAWWLGSRRADRGMLGLLGFSVVCSGAAVVVSGYATGGMLGLPLATGLAGAAVAAGWPGRSAIVPGAVGAGVVGLFGLLVGGVYFAEMPLYRALLLFAAPFLAPILSTTPRDRTAPRAPAALGVALTMALLAVAVVPAVWAYLG